MVDDVDLARDSDNTSIGEFEVFLNGAFFVGCALRGDRIFAEGFAAAQSRVSARLDIKDPGSWRQPTATLGDGRWFNNQEAFTSIVPPFFMTYRGDAFRPIIESAIALLSRAPDFISAKWSISSTAVDFHDSGVGVFSARLAASLKAPATLLRVRRSIEALVNDLVVPCNERIASLSEMFVQSCREALPTHVIEVPWYRDAGASSEAPGLSHAMRVAGETRPHTLLWLHPTYLIDGQGRGSDFARACTVLLPSTIFESVETRGGDKFMPCLGASVIITDHRSSLSRSTIHPGLILDLMNLQWAIIAVAMEADRTLFRRIKAFSATGENAPAAALEREVRSVLTLHERTRSFRASIDTILIDLGGSARSVWDAMARVQGLSYVLESIQEKLDALYQACQSQLAFAATKRQRRLGIAVDIFTTFGVVASIAAIAGFILDNQLQLRPAARAAIIAGAIGFVALVAMVTRVGGRRR